MNGRRHLRVVSGGKDDALYRALRKAASDLGYDFDGTMDNIEKAIRMDERARDRERIAAALLRQAVFYTDPNLAAQMELIAGWLRNPSTELAED